VAPAKENHTSGESQMHTNSTDTSERERQLRELRSIELQQIETRTLLENKALLVQIRDFLREQSRHRNGIDLTIFSHSGANGAPTQRHSEDRNHPPHSQK
jgi:hypothetical protein